MGIFSKSKDCPDIGKTIKCMFVDLDVSMEGNVVTGVNPKSEPAPASLRLEKEFIEVSISELTNRIYWRFSKQEGSSYYFLGTDVEDFHQWIIGQKNITHTHMEEQRMYIRMDD